MDRLVSASRERHVELQDSLERIRHAGVIAQWAVLDGVYKVQRSTNGDWVALGSIRAAETFVLGVWSALNFRKRGAA